MRGEKKTAPFFDISVNWTKNTAALQLVPSTPPSTPKWTSRRAFVISAHWQNNWVKHVVPRDIPELYAYPER